MKTLQVATIALIVGGALGFGANNFLTGSPHDMSAMGGESAASSNDPLYWVAPMDPNYKRDKPGKSPMGMDLIPVYAEDLSGEQDAPGTVTIDPSVENNLGVKTANATLQQLSPRIETVGYIAFDESLLWQTNVRVAGWVEKLYINAVGEKVKKGDVLFTLYSPELVKAQEELLNAYRTGRKGLVKGATERLVTLGVDRAQIKSITRSGKASQTIEIKAPADGVIASLNVREGGYLSPAQAVISAGPLDNVWVDAEVFERQAHWMKAGSQATMTLDAIPGNIGEHIRLQCAIWIREFKTHTQRTCFRIEDWVHVIDNTLPFIARNRVKGHRGLRACFHPVCLTLKDFCINPNIVQRTGTDHRLSRGQIATFSHV